MCSPWRRASVSSSPGGCTGHSRSQSPGLYPSALQVQPWLVTVSPQSTSPALPSSRHCPVFITAAHHTLLWDLPHKWADHSIPLPHSLPWLPSGRSLSAVSVKETTSPTYPAHLLTPTTSTSSSVRVWGFQIPSLKPHSSPSFSSGDSCTSHRTQLSHHSLFKACSPVPPILASPSSALLLALPPPLNTPRQEQLPPVPGTDPAGSSPRLWGPREQVSVASASRAWPRGGLPQGWGPKGPCLPRDPQH